MGHAYIYMRFECQATVVVEQHVLDEQAPVISEALIQRILSPCTEPRLDGVDERIAMALVLDIEELARIIDQLMRLRVEHRCKDETRLHETLASRRQKDCNT